MSVLRNAAFRDLLLAQAVSQFGDSLYFVTFAYMVQQVSGSSTLVGITGALEAIPFLLLSPWAGVLADRFDRKAIMLASDISSCALLLAFCGLIGLHPQLPVGFYMTTACLLSATRTFFNPAKSAAIPQIVAEDKLQQANALIGTVQSFLPVATLTLGALLLSGLAQFPPSLFFAWAVALNGLSFLGSAAFIARLPRLTLYVQTSAEPRLREYREGLSYIGRRKDLRLVLLCQALINLSVSPFFVVFLAANRVWFGNHPQTLSLMELSFCAGLIPTTLLYSKWSVRRVGRAYFASVLGMGVCNACMGFARTPWQIFAYNFAGGLFVPLGLVPINAYLQASVPPSRQGKVQSAWWMASTGSQPVGMALGGVMLSSFGIAGSFLFMGSALLAVGLFAMACGSMRQLHA